MTASGDAGAPPSQPVGPDGGGGEGGDENAPVIDPHVTKAPAAKPATLLDEPASNAASARQAPFTLCGKTVQPGYEATVAIPISKLSTAVPVSLAVRVVHGESAGPTLFVSAAIHGDEIVGVEIIRRLLRRVTGHQIRGTLLLVPVVNMFGFITHDRYLPDRRDLNRSFPGSPTGSLAAQIAHHFRQEIVKRSDFGIDLHTAAVHRTNYPQIRVTQGSDEAARMALAFRPPVIVTAPLRDGSMRAFAQADGVQMLLYEAGEALRFDEFAIRTGVRGILGVMAEMGMIDRPGEPQTADPAISHGSSWLRSPKGGIVVATIAPGAVIRTDDIMATVSDPFGDDPIEIRAPFDGMVIGAATLPVVNQGDALFHVARLEQYETAGKRVRQIADAINADTLLDEDELI